MKTLRFVSLAAVLAMTFLISAHQAALAYPTNPCSQVNGSQCPLNHPGDQRTCWDSLCPIHDQNYLTCTCSSTNHWICQPSLCS